MEACLALEGVWIPLVTPFVGGRPDLGSFDRLIRHLSTSGASGFVVAGTTGEAPVLTDDECLTLAAKALEASGSLPVLVGAGGPDTRKVAALAAKLEALGVHGLLSVCPYYSRPDQRGILAHFRALSEATALPLVLYNIPYRTGVNMQNDTIRRLAEIPTVVGLKDSCGDIKQSTELLFDPPPSLSILTGEDALFYVMLALGARGGILASAHWATESFVAVWRAARANDFRGALAAWRRLASVVPLFFAEPNPGPLKCLLQRAGLIATEEVRLPLVPPSDELRRRLPSSLRR